MPKRDVKSFARYASQKGLSPHQLPLGKLRDYLMSKGTFKRVKLYRGMVVILAKTSNRVITAYPIPEEYMEEYKQYDKQ